MWLLKHDVAARYESWLKLCAHPTDAQLSQLTKFAERRESAIAARAPECLTIAGDVAQISVVGVLTPQPDFWTWLFYGENTSYAEIREALAIASSDPNVKRVAFHVDSPGGHVAGLFETLGAIEAFDKKRTVTASLAASAAYAIAAVAGSIEAVSPASEFGSVGVVRAYYVDETLVEITSTEAPNKRPDPTTEEGKAVIRGELDAIHELFVDAIARGRTRAGKDTDVAKVNTEFGRGGVLLARAALAAGMIDKAPPKPRAAVKADHETGEPSALPENTTEQKPMNLEQLKAQHPELYTSLLAEGEKQGEAKERKRVLAHLKLGKSSGALAVAEKAIASGASSMDEEIFAEYQSAAMNRRDQATRQDDASTASGALDGAKPTSGSEVGKDLGDEVVALMEKERGPKKA